MSLKCPLAQPRTPSAEHSLSQEDANVIVLETLILVLHINVGDARPGTCVHNPTGGLRCVSWNSRGLLGSAASSQRSREQKHIYLRRPARNNDIICLQETHGKDEFLQAVQISHTQFRLFGTFTLNNVNADGSAILIHKNTLPDGATVTHVTTCQGRDHSLTKRSGESVLVVVNVHFEPDLVLGDLRARLRHISLHWPRFPETFGVIIGDLKLCEPEEGRFHVRYQTFTTEGDTGKTALFRSILRMFWKSPSQN